MAKTAQHGILVGTWVGSEETELSIHLEPVMVENSIKSNDRVIVWRG